MATDAPPAEHLPPKPPVTGPFLDLVEYVHAPSGKFLKALYAFGGVRLLHTYVAYPLLVALLAACYLILLAKAPVWPVKDVREWYVEMVRRGFSLNEAAEATLERSNEHIDYFQTVDFVLEREHPTMTMPIQIDAGRRAQVALQLNSVGEECRRPIVDLAGKTSYVGVDVFMKSARGPITTLTVDSDPPFVADETLDATWWKKNMPYFLSQVGRNAAIVVQRTDGGSVLTCPRLVGSLRVSVFKTMAYSPKLQSVAAPTE